MAKSSLIKLAFVIALTIAAGTAYGSVITSSVAIGAGSFVPSNNVKINVVSEPSAFSAASKHMKGDRNIGFSSLDAKLYYSSGAAIDGAPATPGSSTAYSTLSDSSSGWLSM